MGSALDAFIFKQWLQLRPHSVQRRGVASEHIVPSSALLFRDGSGVVLSPHCLDDVALTLRGLCSLHVFIQPRRSGVVVVMLRSRAM